MPTLLEQRTMSSYAPSVAAEYQAAAADARTQIAACWQSATEMAQTDPGLVAEESRVQWLESLRRLLDALAQLDVEVQMQAAPGTENGHRRPFRSRYADVSFEARHAAVAAGTLLAHVRENACFTPTLHTIRLANRRLQHHLDDIGRLLEDVPARAT